MKLVEGSVGATITSASLCREGIFVDQCILISCFLNVKEM